MRNYTCWGMLLLILLGLIAGCRAGAPAEDTATATGMEEGQGSDATLPTDEELLAQYPDDLDAALEELETVD